MTATQDDNGEIIACLEGSFSNVIGLPMEALLRVLSEMSTEAEVAMGTK